MSIGDSTLQVAGAPIPHDERNAAVSSLSSATSTSLRGARGTLVAVGRRSRAADKTEISESIPAKRTSILCASSLARRRHHEPRRNATDDRADEVAADAIAQHQSRAAAIVSDEGQPARSGGMDVGSPGTELEFAL